MLRLSILFILCHSFLFLQRLFLLSTSSLYFFSLLLLSTSSLYFFSRSFYLVLNTRSKYIIIDINCTLLYPIWVFEGVRDGVFCFFLESGVAGRF